MTLKTPPETSVLEKLDRMIEIIDAMTPQELAALVEQYKVTPSKARYYAILEAVIRARGKTQ